MYINFQKFNYKLIPPDERDRYENRDKEAYKEVLKDWLDSNVADFVARRWDIEEILYLKEISDFIKPVREAESLYEFGFFTGCIALVGVSSEDFSKYLSLKNSRHSHIEDTYKSGKRKGQSFDVSQYERLNLQLSEGLINQQTHDLLDEIRTIRNDCLHFNQSFKQKSETDLKNDSLNALNSIKLVLRDNIGTNPDPKDINDLMQEITKSEHNRCFEDMVWKQKNMLSHLLEFSTVQDPRIQKVEKAGLFKVTDLDDEEIELTELEINPSAGTNLLIWVDIDDAGRLLISSNSIQKGDVVFSEVYSNVDSDGQTRFWYLNSIFKVNV